MWSRGQFLCRCGNVAKRQILAQFKEELCNNCRSFNHDRGSQGIPAPVGLKRRVDLSGMLQKGARLDLGGCH